MSACFLLPVLLFWSASYALFFRPSQFLREFLEIRARARRAYCLDGLVGYDVYDLGARSARRFTRIRSPVRTRVETFFCPAQQETRLVMPSVARLPFFLTSRSEEVSEKGAQRQQGRAEASYASASRGAACARLLPLGAPNLRICRHFRR